MVENIKIEHDNTSNLEKVYETIEYKKIIENGEASISILLEKINEQNCMFWFKALSDITGVKNDLEKTKDIRDFWNNWSKENGYC